MRHPNLSALALAAALLGGCASPTVSTAPQYASVRSSDIHKVVLVVRNLPAKYALSQTAIATGGLIGGFIDQGNASNPAGLAAAFGQLPAQPNLYELFNSQLASNLRAKGIDVRVVTRDAYEPIAVAAAAKENEGRWAFYVDNLYIGYYATTMLSAYKPRAVLNVVPYDVKSDTLYTTMPVVVEPTDPQYSFALADSAIKDPSTSFAGLSLAVSEAARMAADRIAGRK